MKVRIFADANVLIAGADSRSGASRAVLLMAEIGLFTLVVSRQVLDEAERNIRQKLPRALPNFADQMVHLNLEILADPPLEDAAKWEAIALKQLETTKRIVNLITEKAVWVRVMFNKGFDLVPKRFDTV